MQIPIFIPDSNSSRQVQNGVFGTEGEQTAYTNYHEIINPYVRNLDQIEIQNLLSVVSDPGRGAVSLRPAHPGPGPQVGNHVDGCFPACRSFDPTTLPTICVIAGVHPISSSTSWWSPTAGPQTPTRTSRCRRANTAVPGRRWPPVTTRPSSSWPNPRRSRGTTFTRASGF